MHIQNVPPVCTNSKALFASAIKWLRARSLTHCWVLQRGDFTDLGAGVLALAENNGGSLPNKTQNAKLLCACEYRRNGICDSAAQRQIIPKVVRIILRYYSCRERHRDNAARIIRIRTRAYKSIRENVNYRLERLSAAWYIRRLLRGDISPWCFAAIAYSRTPVVQLSLAKLPFFGKRAHSTL